MSQHILDQDPFAGPGGIEAYVRAVDRYASAPSAPGRGTTVPLEEKARGGPPDAMAPDRTPASAEAASTLEPPVPVRRGVSRPDGSLDFVGLWERGRRALELRGPRAGGIPPWVESPELPRRDNYRIYPVKRKTSGYRWIERLARRLSLIPGGLRPAIDDFGCDAEYEASVVPIFEFIYRKWLRVRSFDLGNVPSSGRVIVASNHTNWMVLDAAMIEVAIQVEHPARREVRALVDRFTSRLPWLNTFMARTGQVLGCPENALKLLQREELLLVFPEGTRGPLKPYRQRHRVGKFGSGFARIALITQTPIVPVAVQGFEELHPVLASLKGLGRIFGLPEFPLTLTFPWFGLLGLVPSPVKCFIAFGKPISTEAYGPEAAEDEEVVARLAEKVRFIVQDLYEHLRVQRRSLIGS
jgi:1-acyl-sn-glycerol-3-phosphate acyltransferase